MKTSELIVGGVVLAVIGGAAYFYFKNKSQQAAATAEQTAEQQQAAATQQQSQSAYNEMQASVLAALNQNLSNQQSANAQSSANINNALTTGTPLAISELEPTGGIVSNATLVSTNILLSGMSVTALQKLIKTIQANLLSADELNSINNEILFEAGNYVGTLSNAQINQACVKVLKKYQIEQFVAGVLQQ